MTWGACESSVQKALTVEAGFMELKTDLSDNSCSFEVEEGFDYTAALNEIVDGGNSHVEGWMKK